MQIFSLLNVLIINSPCVFRFFTRHFARNIFAERSRSIHLSIFIVCLLLRALCILMDLLIHTRPKENYNFLYNKNSVRAM